MIYLIRHGSVENPGDISYGRMPLPLSAKGKKEMKDLCRMLKDRKITFDAIFSSPVKRALESVEIIKGLFGAAALEIRDEINDVDIGRLEGAPMQILREAKYSEETLLEMRFEIESKAAMIDRTGRFVEEVKEKHQGKTVAFVTHGDICRLILWSLVHPEQKPPRIIKDADYLGVAEAVVLRFDGDNFSGYEFIRRMQGSEVEKDNISRTEAY